MRKQEVVILREYVAEFHEMSAARVNGAINHPAHIARRCRWCGELIVEGQLVHFVHVRVKLYAPTLTQTHFRAWWLYHAACYDDWKHPRVLLVDGGGA